LSRSTVFNVVNGLKIVVSSCDTDFKLPSPVRRTKIFICAKCPIFLNEWKIKFFLFERIRLLCNVSVYPDVLQESRPSFISSAGPQTEIHVGKQLHALRSLSAYGHVG
jgi:hypothetical protein